MMHPAAKNSYASVAVTIVTYNSAKYIRQCVEHVLGQDYPAVQIVVVDNASTDESVALLSPFERFITVDRNDVNVGFAAGQNQAIARTNSDWVLTLNPDVRLMPDFLSKLVAAGEADPDAGTLCGKLLAMAPDFEIPVKAVFDSTGIFMTPNLRHFDRGSQTADDGRFDHDEYVFGATGAAALYRRTMIDDIAIEGEFFDADFFAYREDADVAWRAQLLGWKCRYVSDATAFHVRSVLPSNRRSLPAAINMHSVKNRFLLRIKNATADLYRRFGLSMTLRDAVVIAGCVFYEFRSLRAFPFLFGSFRRQWAKRRVIMGKRRVTDDYMAGWFADKPVSYPVTGIAVPGEKTASK